MLSGAGRSLIVCITLLAISRLGKKQMDMLASIQNDTATAVSSVFGKRLLKKMGWSEYDIFLFANL